MNKKYKLIPSDIEDMFRVKALRSFSIIERGEIGGYIEGEHNLSHEGDCWVFGNAKVSGDAEVYGNAQVRGKAMVYGYARVYENAKVYGNAKVCENARVRENAKVSGEAKLYGNVLITGNDIVTKPVIHMILPKHHITVTDNYVNVGCEQHTLEYWLENYRQIGKRALYPKDMIEAYKNILYALTHFIGE